MTIVDSPLGLRERLRAAREFIAAGRLDEAEAVLEQIEAIADPEVLNVRGALMLARRQFEAAFDFLAGATTAYPDHAALVSNLGIAHELLGRANEAVICLERAAALAPDNEDIKLSLAHALVNRGDVEEAREIAEAATERDPANARAFIQLGAIGLATQDRGSAEASLYRALEITPDDPQILRNLSALEIDRGQFDKALRFAERALLRAPLDSSCRMHLAYCQAAAGHWAEAEATCRKVLAFAPSHVGAHEILARVMIARGNIEDGIGILTRLVRARKTDPSAALSLAGALQMVGRFEEALKVVEAAGRMEGSAEKVSSLKATLELILGRFPPSQRVGLQYVNLIVIPSTTGAFEFMALARLLKRFASSHVVRVIGEPRYMTVLECLSEKIIPYQPDRSQKATPLQSLLSILAVNSANVADDIPYLQPHEGDNETWREALAKFKQPRIGVVWDGGPLGITMQEVRAILPEHATPVSLVTDDSRHDLADWSEAMDAGVHIKTPADMIAAVANLDAVVGPDCFAIHVAGALNKPGFVLLPRGYPWYWAKREGRALWYPSIVTAVQERLGDWDKPLAHARLMLADGLSSPLRTESEARSSEALATPLLEQPPGRF